MNRTNRSSLCDSLVMGVVLTCAIPHKASRVFCGVQPDAVEAKAVQRQKHHGAMTHPPAPGAEQEWPRISQTCLRACSHANSMQGEFTAR